MSGIADDERDGTVRDAVVMLLIDGDRVLAARRGPAVSDGGWWTFPTGSVEPGESQAATVERETLEELELRVLAVAKVWQCRTDDGRYRLHWWTTVVAGTREPRPDGAEIDAVAWVDPEGFLALRPTFEGDRRFVRQILPSLLAPR